MENLLFGRKALWAGAGRTNLVHAMDELKFPRMEVKP
jgi:hypothetical protein